MTALTIRDVPEDAVRTMKIRAAQADQSLQTYLRSLIERDAARPTVAEAVELARRQRHEIATKVETAVGQLAVADFVTPAPARYIKGLGEVTFSVYTRWSDVGEEGD